MFGKNLGFGTFNRGIGIRRRSPDDGVGHCLCIREQLALGATSKQSRSETSGKAASGAFARVEGGYPGLVAKGDGKPRYGAVNVSTQL